MKQYSEDNFDVNEWLDEVELEEQAKDMHYSIYYTPEHDEDNLY